MLFGEFFFFFFLSCTIAPWHPFTSTVEILVERGSRIPEGADLSTHQERGWGASLSPRLLACTPTLTSCSACAATRSLKPGTCTPTSSLSTTESYCPAGRLLPRSGCARQPWGLSCRRKPRRMPSDSRHKISSLHFHSAMEED